MEVPIVLQEAGYVLCMLFLQRLDEYQVYGRLHVIAKFRAPMLICDGISPKAGWIHNFVHHYFSWAEAAHL